MFTSSSSADNVMLFARARSTAWRRVLTGLIAVPAVLVGLLAMHVLAATGDPSGQHSMAATTSVMAQMTGSTPPISFVGGCDQFCGPNHEMGAMACILALLLTALTMLALAAFGGWKTVQAALAAVAAMLAQPVSLSPPRPPSLELLSISRI